MKVIYFATSSEIKFKQYQLIFNDLGVQLKRATAYANVLIEPQMVDNEENIVSHPLRQVARFIEKEKLFPYVIEDTMLLIASLSKNFNINLGLPGADTKNWWKNLGELGLIKILKNYKDRTAKFVCQLGAYLGKSQYCFEQAELIGKIAYQPKKSNTAEKEFPYSNPFFFILFLYQNN